jgi:DNA polymerase III subunit delta'
MKQKQDNATFPPVLLGHADAEAHLAEAVAAGRLPSAYLFTGAKGIGKAGMAMRLASTLLAPKFGDDAVGIDLFGDIPTPATHTLTYDENATALGRMQERSHPDFLWVQPEYDVKKKVFKRDIVVSQARMIGSFLSKTAGEGGWKVIVIDSIDEMNPNAANALLKWLEEPPARSLFILISHAPMGLLPTIRSRCRDLAFTIPPYSAFETVVGGNGQNLPLLHALTGGSFGAAEIWMQSDWHAHMQRVVELINADVKQRIPLLMALVDAAIKDTTFTLPHWQSLLDMLMLAVLQQHQSIPLPSHFPMDMQAAVMRMAASAPVSYWLGIWDAQRGIYRDTTLLYLDKRYSLMQLLGGMTMVATAAKAG